MSSSMPVIVIYCALQPLLIFYGNRFQLHFVATKPTVRFTEVNAISLHHKPVHVAAFATRAQTVPQLFLGIDDEAGFRVRMHWAKPNELLAARRE
jgi:hypothetical protein